MDKKRYVISVGGSLVIPDEHIDTDFLQKFASLLHKQIATYPDRQFFLVVGGGETARKYQKAAKELNHHATNADLDWMGIFATYINAQLVKVMFGDDVFAEVIHDYTDFMSIEKPIIVASGWQPKSSSDGDVVVLAKAINAETIINLSNIDYVYDKDPKQFSDAKPLTTMTWDQLLEIVGDTWIPGMHAPFDPNAVRKAKEDNLTVIMVNGKNIDNIESILEDQEYIGTTVS